MGYGTDENEVPKGIEEQFDWQLDKTVSPPRWVGGIAAKLSGAYYAITTTLLGSKQALDVNVAGSAVPGFNIEDYDYIALTYVAAGDGVGEIETATFKTGGSGGTTVATLTLTYNTDDKIATVTKT